MNIGTRRVIWRISIKTVIALSILNLLFATVEPLPYINQLTIYNWLVPGRDRLPYGKTAESYNLSLNSLEAMFASHKLSRPKSKGEFRVVLIGDSSVWGILLRNEQTLSGYLNAAEVQIGDQRVYFYNIGHPVLSVTKDLMLLDYGMQYQPDLIVWLITLQSLSYRKQLDAPLLQNNALYTQGLIQEYDLHLNLEDNRFVKPSFLDETLIGQRRPLADWWRLQLFGIAWANTGIDQIYGEYDLRRNDFGPDMGWEDFAEPISLTEQDLAFDVLAAGHEVVGDAALLLVNEPIFIADGVNSNLRYNFWYPRWAYDSYRQLLADLAIRNGWRYYDLWNAILPFEFTDSPVHLTPQGSQNLSKILEGLIREVIG
jgi:hypothetical protein